MNSKLPGARCSECPLRDVQGAVPGFGPKNADVIFIGEAPGEHEQAEGIPFVGQSGKLLDAILEEVGFEGEFFKTNIVACRPPNNRTPTQEEIMCCATRLDAELAKCDAEKIVTLGKTAHEAMQIPPDQIGAVYEREFYFDEGYKRRLIMPTWHPAYILRTPSRASELIKCLERVAHGPFDPNVLPDPEVRWVHTVDEMQKAFDECPDDTWVSFDIESDNVRWFDTLEESRDYVLMAQFAWDESFAIIVGDELLYDVPETREVIESFLNRVRVVGQNIKFDAVFMKAHFNISFEQDFDTMLAHYLLDENTKHGLKEVARLWLGIPDYEKDTIQPYLRTKNDMYSKVPPDILAKYGAMDVVAVLRLRKIFEEEMLRQSMLQWPFNNILMKSANMFVDAEVRGMKVDFAQLDWLAGPEAFGGEIVRLTEEIRQIAGRSDLNPNSNQQMAEVFYDDLSLPVPKGRKIKPRSVGKEARAKLWGKHPIIEVFDTYQRVHKMNSSYVLNLRGQVDRNHRVHATFNIPGTEVGRLSVSRPALQTIPRAGDYYGSMIRSAFIPEVGMVLIICDYSQAELRVYACETMDPFLLNVYREGRDLHSEVAIGMFGEDFTKEQRVHCKMFNFSYVYGGNEYSFAQDAGLPIAIARKFVKDYNDLMPVALEWKREQFKKLKAQGYVVTRFGRRRRFPLITAVNAEDARKACVHMPIASSANDLNLMSGNRLAAMGYPVVLEVHDSVLLEVPESDAEQARIDMEKVMMEVGSEFYPEVPWVVDAEVRKRWADPREK